MRSIYTTTITIITSTMRTVWNFSHSTGVHEFVTKTTIITHHKYVSNTMRINIYACDSRMKLPRGSHHGQCGEQWWPLRFFFFFFWYITLTSDDSGGTLEYTICARVYIVSIYYSLSLYAGCACSYFTTKVPIRSQLPTCRIYPIALRPCVPTSGNILTCARISGAMPYSLFGRVRRAYFVCVGIRAAVLTVYCCPLINMQDVTYRKSV